jgi:hypothetical protein
MCRGMCAQVREALQNGDYLERLRAVRRYTHAPGGTDEASGGPAFPPPPTDMPTYDGPTLNDWIPADRGDTEILVG